jgi:hypothetical protein
MPLSLEDQLFFQQGDRVEDLDMLKGRSIELWIKPIVGVDLLPTVYTISVEAAAAVDDVLLSATADDDVTLYRNDVLDFGTGKFAIVKATTTLGAVAVDVPVYPLEATLADTDTARTYAMLPLWSAKEGGLPQSSASYAEGHNKNMGLYAVSQKIREDYTATLTGDVNFKDPCIEIFQNMQTASLSKILVQARHAITTVITAGGTTYINGVGPGAVQYKGNGTITLSDPEAGMVGFSMEVKISGKIDDYVLLPNV